MCARLFFSLQEWSRDSDFDLVENLATEYLSNAELEETLANLENAYPGFAEVFLNEADWSSVISAVRLTDEESGDEAKTNIALFGGVYGSQPVGREILLRLARHFGEGHKRGDPSIVRLFRKINLYILPMLDVGGYNADLMGTCTYDDGRGSRRMSYEVGAKFVSRPTNPREIKAVKQFLANYNIQVHIIRV